MHGEAAEEEIGIYRESQEPKYSEHPENPNQLKELEIGCNAEDRKDEQWKGGQDGYEVNEAVNVHQLLEPALCAIEPCRIFKDEENVTLWVSDDKNKIPIKIKASILVGSVKADLVEATGLAHPFELKI